MVEYHLKGNQIGCRPSANVPIQKERVVIELIRNGKHAETESKKSMNSTVIDNVQLTGKQLTVDRWLR